MASEPRFSAYREESEPSRLVRLHAVWGYAVALANQTSNIEFSAKITELHDHKGVLTVHWKATPTEAEKLFFRHAWMSNVVGDCSANVEHVFE